eukprot:196805-Prymnesium_polylepis.1
MALFGGSDQDVPVTYDDVHLLDLRRNVWMQPTATGVSRPVGRDGHTMVRAPAVRLPCASRASHTPAVIIIRSAPNAASWRLRTRPPPAAAIDSSHHNARLLTLSPRYPVTPSPGHLSPVNPPPSGGHRRDCLHLRRDQRGGRQAQ